MVETKETEYKREGEREREKEEDEEDEEMGRSGREIL